MPCNLNDIQEAACNSGIGREQSKIKLLQLIAQLTCEASQGAGVSWGEIVGTLSDQTDLQAALDAKLSSSANLSDVANAVTSKNNLGIRHFISTTDVVASGTGANTVLTFTLPGGSMGPNGYMRTMGLFTSSNNANLKFWEILFNGTSMQIVNYSSVATLLTHGMIVNRNNQAVQVVNPSGSTAGFPSTTSVAVATKAVDTSADVTVTVNITKVNAGDVLTCNFFMCEVIYIP